MMSDVSDLLRPLDGFIPQSGFGARVVGPPSATISPEQKQAASKDPLSFRFSAGRKTGCSNEEALEWLNGCEAKAVLRRIENSVVVYRQAHRDLTVTGLLGDLSLEAYVAGRVKPHEKTISKAQRKMAGYMSTTRIYGNPTVTTMPNASGLTAALAGHTLAQPDSSFVTVDGASHEMWVVAGEDANQLCKAIDSDLYITDGHHRLASASVVAEAEGRPDSRIPAGVFPSDQVRLRSFARCVFDPGVDPVEVVARLVEATGAVVVTRAEATPRSRFEIGAKVGETYLRFSIPPELVPDDPYSALNINLLQELVLGPIFGIKQPRTDERLGFSANVDGLTEPCPGADAWFLPFHLEASDVMMVADAGLTMPPKSTWFEPKLPSGLLIRPLE